MLRCSAIPATLNISLLHEGPTRVESGDGSGGKTRMGERGGGGAGWGTGGLGFTVKLLHAGEHEGEHEGASGRREQSSSLV